jgi:phage/plasmid-like protein (TIGR03299 family)
MIMSAVIDMSRGFAGMAYVGETPWHSMGQKLQPGSTPDEFRIEAGMNYKVDSRAVLCESDGGVIEVPNRRVLVRDDIEKPLAVVSNRYKVHQPKTIIEFFNDLCSDYGYTMETLGGLDEGKKIWALARTPNTLRLHGTDKVDGFVLLATSYDGSLNTVGKLTTVRVVCQNTLSASLAGSGNAVRVRHTTELDEKAMKLQLGLVGDNWARFEQDAAKLSETQVTLDQTRAYFETLLGKDAFKTKDGEKVDFSKKFYGLVDALTKGAGANEKSAAGTAWGLVNAVSHYTDHDAPAKGNKENNRLNSAWFGAGEELKNKAFGQALDLVAA